MSEQPTETVPLGPPGDGRKVVPLPRGASVGRYVVLDLLGSGGMGVVYSAYDPELDRKVALKLLRPDRVQEESRQRLLREAQAVARLSHPNVVAVYDAGTLDDRVFVAMELVAGQNLRQWLDGAEPSPGKVLAAIVEAGRGLAAAHAAGLVHRDVKPENVLIGEDGRVRVADFGLARRVDQKEGAGMLTSPGMVVGTPSYMAPEQRRGDPVDARSDQYSFCTMAWEALFRRRPPAGDDRRVASRVRQALLRGLGDDPADRHSSMEGLLAELTRDPASIRRRWLAAAAVAAILGASLVSWQRGRESRVQLCRGAAARIASVWNAERKQAVRTAFAATRAPYARKAGATVEGTLERYFTSWSAMHREACEATHLRGEQSGALLDRRMSCLDQRLGEAKVLVEVLSQSDVQTVEKAVELVNALPPVAGCADAATLLARVPPPADPGVRSRVEALQARLARARLLGIAGRYRDGLAVAREAAAAAAQTPYPPIAAEALLVQGDLEQKADEPENAARTLLAAVAGAEAAGHDEVKARAAIVRLRVLGSILLRFDEAHQWETFASAAVARLDRDDLKAEELTEIGILYEAEGKYAEALESVQKALAIRRRLGVPAPDLAVSLSSVGILQFRAGHIAESRRYLTEALELQKEALGSEHPEVADTLNGIGTTFYAQGLHPQALDAYHQALLLREAAFGPVHRLVADSLINVANVQDTQGHPDEALANYRRAEQIQRQVFGPRHPALAMTLDNMGEVYLYQKRVREALRHHQSALELRLATLGADHPRTARTRYNIGRALSLEGKEREALAQHRQALDIRERALGADHPDVAASLTAVAEGELHLGEARQALSRAERALRILEGTEELDPLHMAATRFVLAQALWQTGGDRPRALRLARQALVGPPPPSPLEKAERAEIQAWLAAREP